MMQTKEPRRYFGHFLYKYGSCAHLEWLKPIILENRLYIPTPRELNDPSEARPPLSAASIDALIKSLISLTSERRPFLTRDALAKEAAQIKFNVPRFGTEVLLRDIEKALYQHLETFRIYSLAKRPDNQHLWERYAAGHTGYCMEFLNEGSFQPSFEVRYSDFTVDITDDEQVKPYFFFYKTQRWSKEEEVRMIMNRSCDATHIFDQHLLTKLILGKAIKTDDAAKIRAWACERRPSLKIIDEMGFSS